MCLIVLGVLLNKSKKFPENTSQVLNLFVIYVSLPALVMINVPNLVFTSSLWVTVITPWAMLLISVLIVLFFARLFAWKKDTIGALLLIVPLGNTSFLGYPMVEAFFGSDAVGYAVMYDQFGSFFALTVYGSIIVAIYSEKTQSTSFTSIVQQIILFPPFISFIIALCISGVNLPSTYYEVLTPIAKTLIPVVMVAVGFQLNLRVEFDKIRAFIVGLSVKMIIAPLLAYLAFLSLGMKGEIVQVTVFEAAMPPMITAGAIAIMANLSPRLTAAIVTYGILLSFITIPLWHYILTM